ncbi:diphthine--ammonia ligase [Paenibacillus sp. J5C_2022]|uniref:Dph6-related ATP pyrophosphatase n=1 Tax=Paenibacillus sp. J5C2022 TaxID=2977129 RepID=UPI0021D39017|nr:diphthine--ammonia ligase [Paenibacillus sp. J5C2022]MCU6712081.1 diphthine--ammonia ligase [Paenibacillus sp. J5C2022]
MADEKDWLTGAAGRRFIASYSGGKDSSLALYRAMQTGKAIGIIVMLEEEGQRSRSHGMPPAIIQAQADAIGLPVYTAATSWDDYERKFTELLIQAREQGAEVLITGDLDVPEEDCWHERVAGGAGLVLGMPLWRMDHVEAVTAFIDLGFIAVVVTVNLSLGMSERDLGRQLDRDFVQELISRGIDPCGEGGEFHTTVIDGPLFRHPVPVRRGDIARHGKYAFLPLELQLQ